MRGLKRSHSAATLARGHALLRNLRGGCSSLPDQVVPTVRLTTALAQLIQAI
jgi:hypothetical protein